MTHQSRRNDTTCQVCQVFTATITDLGNLWPAQASPTKATARVAEARYFPEPAGHRKHGWVAAPWLTSVDSPRSVSRNRRGSSVRSASASRGQKYTDVQRHRRRIHIPHCTIAPLFKDGSQVCNLSGAVSEETWQLLISTLQSVRDETFGDLSIYAQNPLGGRVCIH